LLSYLQQNTAGMKYLMAVPSSMAGAGYVLATGRPVLYIGGFNGQDPVATSTDLARLVAEGQLRYIYRGGGGGPGPSGQSSISSWVASQCTVVSGLGSATGSSGAGNFTPGPGGSQGTLYDCGG
jgi:4-amino-4-deoxy-L-arabinose transferase-like glycosyltransferase